MLRPALGAHLHAGPLSDTVCYMADHKTAFLSDGWHSGLMSGSAWIASSVRVNFAHRPARGFCAAAEGTMK